MNLIRRILATGDHWPVIFIRVMAGWVFWSEGVQKFIYPELLGVGRFIKIGIPYPELLAPFVGIVEISCGMLFIAGLLTRFAAIPLIVDMLVAIAVTNIPILLHAGFWAMSHEGRVDLCMLLGSVCLLISGVGPWSFDSMIVKRRFMKGS